MVTMATMSRRSSRPRFTGSVLIEAMITIVVVSLGLLTVAGLLINSLKGNASAVSRTQAMMLTEDILDRMRANRNVALVSTSPYNLAITANTPALGSNPTVATQDLKFWRDSLAASLPSGTGGIAVNGTTGLVTVTITWDDTSRRATSAQITNSGTIVVEAKL